MAEENILSRFNFGFLPDTLLWLS